MLGGFIFAKVGTMAFPLPQLPPEILAPPPPPEET
jgi:hypothetical protein